MHGCILYCSYWCPGAQTPVYQHQQCWLNIHCTGSVPNRNITIKGDNIRKKNHINIYIYISSCLVVNIYFADCFHNQLTMCHWISIYRYHLISTGILNIKIRQSWDHLNFTMEILIHGKTVFILKQHPILNYSRLNIEICCIVRGMHGCNEHAIMGWDRVRY